MAVLQDGENAKLKRLLAVAMLDNAALKDLLTRNGDARCPGEKPSLTSESATR